MLSLFVCLFSVSSLSALLCAINARDQFSDEVTRALIFARFREQRRKAKLGYLGLSTLCLTVGAAGVLVPVWPVQVVGVVLAGYLAIGCAQVLYCVDALGYDKRNQDPVLQGVALVLAWPFWSVWPDAARAPVHGDQGPGENQPDRQ